MTPTPSLRSQAPDPALSPILRPDSALNSNSNLGPSLDLPSLDLPSLDPSPASRAGLPGSIQPLANQTDYRDSWSDRLLISLFIRKLSQALGEQTSQTGYAGVVDLSRRIMQGRSPAQQQTLVAKVLNSMVPGPVLWFIRRAFSPTQWVCEANAWFAARLFPWLIGPCELVAVEVTGADGKTRIQTSDVHIQKCRYLEASGCVGLCINLCKLPTQQFFTEQFGIPLTLTPNFEDLSCEMVFGQMPPPLETEAAHHQPCLRAGADGNVPCPKVRS
jgi:hypothetical protein